MRQEAMKKNPMRKAMKKAMKTATRTAMKTMVMKKEAMKKKSNAVMKVEAKATGTMKNARLDNTMKAQKNKKAMMK